MNSISKEIFKKSKNWSYDLAAIFVLYETYTCTLLDIDYTPVFKSLGVKLKSSLDFRLFIIYMWILACNGK